MMAMTLIEEVNAVCVLLKRPLSSMSRAEVEQIKTWLASGKSVQEVAALLRARDHRAKAQVEAVEERLDAWRDRLDADDEPDCGPSPGPGR